MVWGGRREEGSGWGTHVYLWQIHFDIWQNQYNIENLKNIMNRIVPTEQTTVNKPLCISEPIKPLSCVKKITEYRECIVEKN